MQKIGTPLIFRITNTAAGADDTKTYDKFSGIRVDGSCVEPSDYKIKRGSVIIELQPNYLDTLNVGVHRLTAEFEDGTAETEFTVVENTVKPESLPQTGDTERPLVYGLAVLVALIGLRWLSKKK